jgi:hypothetical protein
MWDHWPWLLVPLVLGISFAYKATKVATPRELVLESLKLTIYLIGGLILAALALSVVVAIAT